MIALVIGLVIGFLMCIPIGPINIWVINTFIRRGAAQALSIAVGGSLMDFIYFYVILSGISLFTISDQAIFYFKAGGIALIFLLGLKELLSKAKEVEVKDTAQSPARLASGFFLGVIIYTSNPTLIITMTGLGTFVKSLELFDLSRLNIFLTSLGLALGSFAWFGLLVFVTAKYESKIRDKYLGKFVKLSGGLMVALSLFMTFKLATT